ncbi:MAG: UDP-2,3-diacylglucosamine diphosphatase, partial [Gammaproteobacteria bacterium]|nr:UDP-2,3-diacylglucosamine diphosphatase [Gammaproteobacteria bacterium]
YVLGDLFEYWIGDDGIALLGYQDVIAGVKSLTERDIPVYFMHGNRDFLIGSAFCDQTGCKLLHDPTVIHLHGQAVLLMHGDSLCTDDVEHQEFRTKVRASQWQNEFLGKTLSERNAIAISLRKQSEAKKSYKTMEFMDVNQQAVEQAMRHHGTDILIHGHTHRPGVHNFTLDQRRAQRIVLGDWYEQGSILTWDESGSSLRSYSE